MVKGSPYFQRLQWHFGKWSGFVVLSLFLAVSFLVVGGCGPFLSEEKTKLPQERGRERDYIILATTTSTYDSGLLDELLPAFVEEYGVEVRVVSQGTGQSLENGRRGDVDVLLVHDRPSELRLVELGYVIDRRDIMYNDFVLVGPAGDPAGVRDLEKVADAFSAIASGEHLFISRGDDSGTHRTELAIWGKTGRSDFGEWYLSVGQGMGQAMSIAYELQAYTLSDRGTFLTLKDTLDLEILLEEDPLLYNQYGIMAVNPEKHPHVNYRDAARLVGFMASPRGQALISGFRVNGESLFFPGWSGTEEQQR